MRDQAPTVREQPLSVEASLLAYAIFTALLILSGIPDFKQWDARVKTFPAQTGTALTVARLPVNFTRFLF